MHPVKTFHVRPALPERLKALEELAYNLRWSWDPKTISLFRRLDRQIWGGSGHNPVLMLASMTQERFQELAQDDAFVAHLDSVVAGLRDYVAGPRTWYQKHYDPPSRPLVAYFSLEFGLTESLPIYSGGLGILAGDHLKSTRLTTRRLTIVFTKSPRSWKRCELLLHLDAVGVSGARPRRKETFMTEKVRYATVVYHDGEATWFVLDKPTVGLPHITTRLNI